MFKTSTNVTICPDQSQSTLNNLISTHDFNTTKRDMHVWSVRGTDRECACEGTLTDLTTVKVAV